MYVSDLALSIQPNLSSVHTSKQDFSQQHFAYHTTKKLNSGLIVTPSGSEPSALRIPEMQKKEEAQFMKEI